MKLIGEIVIIKRSGDDGARFPMNEDVCSIGRQAGSSIRIQLPSVETLQCRLEANNDGDVVIKHLAKQTATLLNGQPLAKPVVVHHNDVIKIVDKEFRFEYPRGHKLRTATPRSTTEARRKSSVKGKRKSSVANATEKNISPGSKENDGPLSAEKKKTPSSGRKTSLGLSVANNSGVAGESTLKSTERKSVGKSPKQRSSSVDEWSTPNGTGRKALANESKSSENVVMSASRGTAAKSASRKRISSVASTAKEAYQDIPSELPTIGMSGKSLTPARRFLLAKQVEEFSVSRRSLKKDLQRTPQSGKSAQKKRRSSVAKRRVSSGAVAPTESDDQSTYVTKTPPSSAGKGSAQKTSTGKKSSARKSKTPSSASRVKTPGSAGKDAVDISGSAGKVKTPLSSGKEKSASKLTPSRSASTDDKVATPRMPTPRARLLDTPSPKVTSRKGTPVTSASKSNAKISTSGEGKRGSTARQGRRPQSVGGKAISENVAAQRRAKSLSPATARKMAVVSVASLKADAARVVVTGRKSTDRVASPMPVAAKASPASSSGKAMSPHDHSDSSFSAKSPVELKKQLAELRRRSQLVPEDEETTVPETPSSASRVKETGSGKKRKSGDTFAVPMSKRDKRVSFGPNLSPEQYALWLPASAPLKRGSTPQRSGTPRPPPKRQQQEVIEEDEDVVNSQLPVMLQQLVSTNTTPKPQTPRIVSLTPTARSTTTTPVQRIVMSGGKVVPSSASKLPVSLSLTKVPLSSVKSPVIAFVVKKTPVREMTVVTSPSSSAADKTPRTGTLGTVDKGSAVMRRLNVVTPSGKVIVVKTPVSAAVNKTPVSAVAINKTPVSAAAVNKIPVLGARIKTPTSKVIENQQVVQTSPVTKTPLLASASKVVDVVKTPVQSAAKTPVPFVSASKSAAKVLSVKAVAKTPVSRSVATPTPAASVSHVAKTPANVLASKTPVALSTNKKTPAVAKAVISSVGKSSVARAIISSAVRKSVARSAKKNRPLWSDILKGRKSINAQVALQQKKEATKAASVVTKKRTTIKAKTPAKRPAHLTTGHALSPSPLVIGRSVQNFVTKATSAVVGSEKRAKGKKSSDANESVLYAEIPETPGGPGEMAVSPWLATANKKKLSATPTSTSRGVSVAGTPVSSAKKARPSAVTPRRISISGVTNANSASISGKKASAQKLEAQGSKQRVRLSVLPLSARRMPNKPRRRSLPVKLSDCDVLPLVVSLTKSLGKHARSIEKQKQRASAAVDLEGVKELFKTPKVNKVATVSPKLDGIARMVKTPKQAKTTTSPQLDGLKQLMQTPKQKSKAGVRSPVLDGLKRLMKTPKNAKNVASPLLDGIKELLRTPMGSAAKLASRRKSYTTPVALPVSSSGRKIVPTSKVLDAPSPRFSGIKRMFKKTSPAQKLRTPTLKSIRRIFKTTVAKKGQSPNVSGVAELFLSPVAVSRSTVNSAKKSAVAKGERKTKQQATVVEVAKSPAAPKAKRGKKVVEESAEESELVKPAEEEKATTGTRKGKAPAKVAATKQSKVSNKRLSTSAALPVDPVSSSTKSPKAKTPIKATRHKGKNTPVAVAEDEQVVTVVKSPVAAKLTGKRAKKAATMQEEIIEEAPVSRSNAKGKGTAKSAEDVNIAGAKKSTKKAAAVAEDLVVESSAVSGTRNSKKNVSTPVKATPAKSPAATRNSRRKVVTPAKGKKAGNAKVKAVEEEPAVVETVTKETSRGKRQAPALAEAELEKPAKKSRGNNQETIQPASAAKPVAAVKSARNSKAKKQPEPEVSTVEPVSSPKNSRKRKGQPVADEASPRAAKVARVQPKGKATAAAVVAEEPVVEVSGKSGKKTTKKEEHAKSPAVPRGTRGKQVVTSPAGKSPAVPRGTRGKQVITSPAGKTAAVEAVAETKTAKKSQGKSKKSTATVVVEEPVVAPVFEKSGKQPSKKQQQPAKALAKSPVKLTPKSPVKTRKQNKGASASPAAKTVKAKGAAAKKTPDAKQPTKLVASPPQKRQTRRK